MGVFARWISVLAGAGFAIAAASAESLDDIRADLQDALNRNDAVAAQALADTLYEVAMAKADIAAAGAAAFTRGEILLALNNDGEAAQAYELCAQHYRSIGSAAEELQCAHKAGTTYLSSGRPGKGLDMLEAAAKELEDLGQHRSGLAASIYLSLADATMPSKLDREGLGAGAKRRDVIDYSDSAMEALKAIGHHRSEMYATALYMKAEALEQMEDRDQAAMAYKAFIDLYQTLPDHSEDVLANAVTRYNIVRFANRDDDNTLVVSDHQGEEITLTIDRRRRIRFPRIDGNKVVDGARVSAEITLGEDGRPKLINILSSYPDEAFGDAFRKGAEHWRFMPPDGISPEDIPPFEYGMVFYVHRR